MIVRVSLSLKPEEMPLLFIFREFNQNKTLMYFSTCLPVDSFEMPPNWLFLFVCFSTAAFLCRHLVCLNATIECFHVSVG